MSLKLDFPGRIRKFAGCVKPLNPTGKGNSQPSEIERKDASGFFLKPHFGLQSTTAQGD
jgi:hypothetical protein